MPEAPWEDFQDGPWSDFAQTPPDPAKKAQLQAEIEKERATGGPGSMLSFFGSEPVNQVVEGATLRPVFRAVGTGVSAGLNKLLDLSSRAQGLGPYQEIYKAGQPIIPIPGAHPEQGNQENALAQPNPLKVATLRALEGLTTPENVAMAGLPFAGGNVARGAGVLFSAPMITGAIEQGQVAMDPTQDSYTRQVAGWEGLIAGLLGTKVMQTSLAPKAPVPSGLKPGDVESRIEPRDYYEAETGVPISRALPAPGETYKPVSRVPPAGNARFATTPNGGTVDLSQLSVEAQREIFAQRGETVRPRSGEIPIIGGQPKPQRPIFYAPEGRVELPSDLPSKPIENVAGGKISFAAEAEAKGIPNARQSALTPVEADIIQSFITEEANAGRPVAVPQGVSYRAPKPAPSMEEFARRERKANVERGLTVEEIPMEPLAPETAQFPGSEGTGALSRLQRDRLRIAIEQNKGSTVIKNILRMGQGTPPTGGGIGAGIRAAVEKNKEAGMAMNPIQAVADLHDKFSYWVKKLPSRERVSQLLDAAEGVASNTARQFGNRIRVGLPNRLDRQALTFVIESGGDPAQLSNFATKVAGKDPRAVAAVDHAMANFSRLLPYAQQARAIMDQSRQAELTAGLNVDEAPNYIKHSYDMPRRGILFDARGTGVSSINKQRTYSTYADAIEQGLRPNTYDAAALVESRLAAGGKLVGRRKWVENLTQLNDPEGQPLVAPLKVQPKGTKVPPKGYQSREVLPGVSVGVRDGYAGIFDALTGQNIVKGNVVGRALLGSEAFVKHGLLLFDTFHASRMAQKQLFLTGKVGYNKGLSLLEYDNPTINRLERAGDITPEVASWVRRNRGDADLLMRNGLNVGRHAEAIYADVIRKEIMVGGKDVNVVGRFNKWVFEKMTRGAMLQSALYELERSRANHPTWTEAQHASYVAKQINVYFGNLGRQGLFKSGSAQDLLRIAFLAPQWVESMVQTEARAYKQFADIPKDALTKQEFALGTAAKGVGTGLAAYILATQLINMATTGHPTWQNEEGHKLDAYIPDPTGKSGGFWLNPLSVVAEVTHDMVRYTHSKDSALDAAAQILQNKESPLVRAAGTALFGRDYTGAKILGTGERLKQAGKALLPVPLPAAGFTSDQPGQNIRQLVGMTGVKVEIARPGVRALDEMANKKFGKSYDELTFRQRFQVAKGIPKESKSLQQQYAIAQKATDNDFKRIEETHNAVKSDLREWLDKHHLQLIPADHAITRSGVAVPLTDKEFKTLQAATIRHYDEMLPKLLARYPQFDTYSPERQKKALGLYMTQARNLARREQGYPLLK